MCYVFQEYVCIYVLAVKQNLHSHTYILREQGNRYYPHSIRQIGRKIRFVDVCLQRDFRNSCTFLFALGRSPSANDDEYYSSILKVSPINNRGCKNLTPSRNAFYLTRKTLFFHSGILQYISQLHHSKLHSKMPNISTFPKISVEKKSQRHLVAVRRSIIDSG